MNQPRRMQGPIVHACASSYLLAPVDVSPTVHMKLRCSRQCHHGWPMWTTTRCQERASRQPTMRIAGGRRLETVNGDRMPSRGHEVSAARKPGWAWLQGRKWLDVCHHWIRLPCLPLVPRRMQSVRYLRSQWGLPMMTIGEHQMNIAVSSSQHPGFIQPIRFSHQ